MSQSENDVVVSGRVRLARNYHDLPFSNLSNPENAQLCIDRAREAMARSCFIRLRECPRWNGWR